MDYNIHSLCWSSDAVAFLAVHGSALHYGTRRGFELGRIGAIGTRSLRDVQLVTVLAAHILRMLSFPLNAPERGSE